MPYAQPVLPKVSVPVTEILVNLRQITIIHARPFKLAEVSYKYMLATMDAMFKLCPRLNIFHLTHRIVFIPRHDTLQSKPSASSFCHTKY